ncbi:MAG: SUMF1/EgtB/PvdO family nonheme iron enzyme [Bacteroidota bacterium]
MPRPVTAEYRVFVASPGEMQPERDALDGVIAELNDTFGEQQGIRLKLVRWETDSFPALGPIQEIINGQVEPYDVFVGLFWKRFGTPTAVVDSGTEEEFLRAHEQWQKDERLPVLFYFCERPFMPSSAGELEQMGKVLRFKQAYPGLYFTFDTTEDFVARVRVDLQRALTALLDAAARDSAPPASPPTAGAPPKPNASTVARARRRYLERLRRDCHVLPLAAIGGKVDMDQAVTLDKVYVALNTTTRTEPEEDKRQRAQRSLFGEPTPSLTARDAVEAKPHVVLLGDPGAGKSTFVKQWLADYASRALDAEPGTDEPIPVFVTLRNLIPGLRACDTAGMSRQQREVALSDVLVDHVLATLTDADAFTEPMREALADGRVVLVLDGLDEVPHDLRPRVRDAVQAVLRRFNPGRLIVTCRIRSYSDADERLSGLPSHTLAPFDDEQKQQFARAWYAAQHALDRLRADEVEAKSDDLAEAALGSALAEIASNPMLLTTMAIVHQEEKRLPDQRVALYKRAVDVLLRRWQTYKTGEALPDDALAPFLKDERRLRATMERLAYEAHRTGRGNREAAALARMDALRLIEERMGSLDLAEAFLTYVDRRAGLLTGQGGTTTKPDTFTFPHRTFQEYLAGCHLLSERGIGRTLHALAEEGDYWRVAVQLAAEELFYINKGGQNAVLDLAYGLCPAVLPDTEAGQRRVLWSAAMAVLVGREQVKADTGGAGGGEPYLERLRTHLVAMLGGALPPVERAEAGRHLAVLGDPRKAVTTVEHMDWCLVPAGPFQMGSPDSDEYALQDEKPLHEVTLTYDYWIGRFPVTVAQWRAFVVATDHEPSEPEILHGFDNHPVTDVTWHDAQAFCVWLTDRLYQVAVETQAKWMGGADERFWSGLLRKQLRVRLPSEAEWEKAARGAEDVRRFPWGDTISTNDANYSETGIRQASAVGCFPSGASPFGVEDMSGNVDEWTRDHWQKTPYENHADAEVVDPKVSSGANAFLLRGGNFIDSQIFARCAYRGFSLRPLNHYDTLGFRVVVHTTSED